MDEVAGEEAEMQLPTRKPEYTLEQVYISQISEFLLNKTFTLPLTRAQEQRVSRDLMGLTRGTADSVLRNELYGRVKGKEFRRARKNQVYRVFLGEMEMFMGEFVANAVQHSKGDVFQAYMFRKERGLYVAVHDRGTGFDLDAVLGKEEKNFISADSRGRGTFLVSLASNVKPYAERNEEFTIYAGKDVKKGIDAIIGSLNITASSGTQSERQSGPLGRDRYQGM